MSYIEVKGGAEPVKLFYRDLGSGTPIVFIHGWPLSHEMWEYQLTEFAGKGYRCIAYDRRGFGRSSQPLTGYDYDTFAADLAAVIDTLGLENVILVGFSMGGGEVARYLGRYGASKISKAVLLGSVTPYMLKTDDNPDGAPKEVFDDIQANIKKDRIGFLDDFGKQFFGVGLLNHPVSAPFLENNRNLAALASPFGTYDCVTAFSSTDFRNDLAAITIPTLIIHGTSDKTVPIDVSGRRTARLLPDAQYIEYDGAPHGFYYTHKDELNRQLREFIEGGVVTPPQQPEGIIVDPVPFVV